LQVLIFLQAATLLELLGAGNEAAMAMGGLRAPARKHDRTGAQSAPAEGAAAEKA